MLNHLEREYPCTYHKEVGYPYRVWIFVIALTPLIFGLTEFSMSGEQAPMFGFFNGLFIQFSMLFKASIQLAILCIPVVICYIILFWMISALFIRPIGKKLLLAAIGIFGMYIVGSAVTGHFFNIFLASERHYLVYAAVFLILSLAFRFEKK